MDLKRRKSIDRTHAKLSYNPFAAFFSSSRRCHRLLFVFSFNILLQLFSSLKVLDTFLSDTLFRFIPMGFIYSCKNISQFELNSLLKQEHHDPEVRRTLYFQFSCQILYIIQFCTIYTMLYCPNVYALLMKIVSITDCLKMYLFLLYFGAQYINCQA